MVLQMPPPRLGVVYVRVLYEDATISVSMLSSRTRVVPLKTLTIPRLELCGALLTARFLKSLGGNLQVDSNHIYAWTDTSIVLSWLKASNSRLKAYVANLGSGYQRTSPSATRWRPVPFNSKPS